MRHADARPYGMRTFALGYLALLLFVPLGMIFFRVFEEGIGNAIEASVTSPEGMHAFWLTIEVRGRSRSRSTRASASSARSCSFVSDSGARALLNPVIDLPFADLARGDRPLAVPRLRSQRLVSAARSRRRVRDHLLDTRGSILATVFVSLPFVVREVCRCCRRSANEQEQAAQTLGASGWQTFWRVTLPAIRWGVVYGVVLATARALGEFGAVSVVSGQIAGKTETLPLFVRAEFKTFNVAGAYGRRSSS